MAGENTKLTGTLLISAISPYNSTDTYPTHYAKYGHGGYRTVHDIIDLDNIPHERREEGMLVYVATEDKIYKYKDGGFAILELGSGNSDDALTEAKAYTDELIKKYPVLEVVNDENVDTYNQNNCVNFYTDPYSKTLVSHPMRYIDGVKENGTQVNNIAEGNYSTVIGYGCQILGSGDNGASNSFCGGDECIINGHKDSFVYGKGLSSSGSHQTVFGKFNKPLAWDDSIALMIGWGENDSSRKNLLVLQNGNTNTSDQSADGGLMTYGPLKPGANYINDFSEYFEWFDGNPNNEDRVGYMVQLNGGKIELAESFEKCIGIISVTSAFVGNSCSLEWHGKYLKDNLGRIIHEEIDGKQVPKINPNYNDSLEYVPRDRRKEWGNVGILGQILVRQDGTLEAGDYAGCLNGIATKSTDNKGYRVLRIVDEEVALVLVK